jgi:hypothetical protein
MRAGRFAAYYEGRKIAKAKTLGELLNIRRVRRLLGEKEFLIRHLDSGKAKVIYLGSKGFLKAEKGGGTMIRAP